MRQCRPRAEGVEVGRESADHVQNDLLDPLRVLGEDLEDRPRVDGLGALEHAGVVVGDQRDVDDGHAELATQVRLGVLGHRDDLPTGVAEPFRLGLRGEARPVDDHDRAALVERDVVLADHIGGHAPEHRVVDVG